MDRPIKIALIFVGILAVALLCPPTAYAQTAVGEIPIANQPDKLVLQLGPDWAGAEFELRTDAGVFPVPVAADAAGILRVDLGGSKTYTLTRIVQAPQITQPPAPATVNPPTPESQLSTGAVPASPPDSEPAVSTTETGGIPTAHLVMFLGGLSIALGGLITMLVLKHRRDSYYDDGEDDDE